MPRLRGGCAGGERLIGKVPHGHWNITTFIAGLRCDGIVAPMVTDGAMSGEIFLAYIRQFLVSVLKPGDHVIMDNPPALKIIGVRPAIESAGVVLFYLLPLFTGSEPDRNGLLEAEGAVQKGD